VLASGVRDTANPLHTLGTLSDQVFGKEVDVAFADVVHEHLLICNYPTPNPYGVEDQHPKEHQYLALRRAARARLFAQRASAQGDPLKKNKQDKTI